MSETTPKPQSRIYRPDLVRLPRLTVARKIVRRILQSLVRFLVWLFLKIELRGGEHIPMKGPVLIVSNHLGDADLLVGLAVSRVPAEILAKIELHDLPIIGWLLDLYGTIWVHRGRPDRRLIRAVLKGLAEGRIVSVAPEGRESLTGSLEEGTRGAAYFALKASVPILPVAFTGTENWRVYQDMKSIRRTEVTVTIGAPFKLTWRENRRQALQEGTEKIMCEIASLLPPQYQGTYRTTREAGDECSE